MHAKVLAANQVNIYTFPDFPDYNKVDFTILFIKKIVLDLIYSVFKKEGGKVKGYYTTKKLILGAFKGFIVIVRMGHLINCIKLPKNFTLKLKI